MSLREICERVAAVALPIRRERRRHRRLPAGWRLRVSFGGWGFASAHAENVSMSGIGLSLTSASAAALLKPGRTVDVEVYDKDEPVFRVAATVRHRAGALAGLELAELMPAELLPAVRDRT